MSKYCTAATLSTILLALLILCSCNTVEQKTTDHKVRLAIGTTGMIADVLANIAGDTMVVETLIAAGVDPHLYKATRSDISKLNSADIIFYNGLLLEGKITDALIRVATSGKKVYAVSELIDSSVLLEPEEFQGHYDPHVWMNPRAWAKTAVVIEEKLSQLYPELGEQFASSTAEYLEQLGKLDTYCEKVLNSVPEGSRVMLTAHDAFNYFGKRYGFEVLGIQGISTESEAGVRDIERLVDTIVEKKIKAVFVESTVSKRNINALIEGARARGHKVIIGGELFSDAMGQEGTYLGTYIGMIDHNATTIARALGGEAPEGGFMNKLEPNKKL